MAAQWKIEALKQQYLYNGNLYKIESLHRILFALGYSINKDDLYQALKITGFIKLIKIRDRLIELKRKIPKHEPFSRFRQMIKWPLLVSREEDLFENMKDTNEIEKTDTIPNLNKNSFLKELLILINKYSIDKEELIKLWIEQDQIKSDYEE